LRFFSTSIKKRCFSPRTFFFLHVYVLPVARSNLAYAFSSASFFFRNKPPLLCSSPLTLTTSIFPQSLSKARGAHPFCHHWAFPAENGLFPLRQCRGFNLLSGMISRRALISPFFLLTDTIPFRPSPPFFRPLTPFFFPSHEPIPPPRLVCLFFFPDFALISSLLLLPVTAGCVFFFFFSFPPAFASPFPLRSDHPLSFFSSPKYISPPPTIEGRFSFPIGFLPGQTFFPKTAFFLHSKPPFLSFSIPILPFWMSWPLFYALAFWPANFFFFS